MRITRKADYSVRTVLFLSKENKRASVKEISKEMRIPENLLAKILQVLAKNKIVISRRGINGGFELNRRPERITLLEIIELIDGTLAINHCAVNKRACSLINHCSVHPVWVSLREEIRGRLKKINFKELSQIQLRR